MNTKSFDYDKLSHVERTVYQVLSIGDLNPQDVSAIADACRFSEIQVKAALQLLSFNRLIPDPKDTK